MTRRRDRGIGEMVAALQAGSRRGRGVEPHAAHAQAAAPRGPGRPPGKKSNPDYRQHSVWLRRTTHRAAMALLRAQNPDTADFSELVEELVATWNAKHARR